MSRQKSKSPLKSTAKYNIEQHGCMVKIYNVDDDIIKMDEKYRKMNEKEETITTEIIVNSGTDAEGLVVTNIGNDFVAEEVVVADASGGEAINTINTAPQGSAFYISDAPDKKVKNDTIENIVEDIGGNDVEMNVSVANVDGINEGIGDTDIEINVPVTNVGNINGVVVAEFGNDLIAKENVSGNDIEININETETAISVPEWGSDLEFKEKIPLNTIENVNNESETTEELKVINERIDYPIPAESESEDENCDIFASSIKKHLKYLHKEKKSYTCNSCGKVFLSQESLAVHIKSVHESSKYFKCHLCNMKFTKNEQLQNHTSLFHSPLPDEANRRLNSKKHKCIFCYESFSKLVDLEFHKKSVHEGIICYQCEICSKIFYAQGSLEKHMSTDHEKMKIEKLDQDDVNDETLIQQNQKEKQEQNEPVVVCGFKGCHFVTKHKKNLARHRKSCIHNNLNQQFEKKQDITKNNSNVMANLNKTSKQEQSVLMESNSKKKLPNSKIKLIERSKNFEEYYLPFGWTKKCSKRISGQNAGRWDVILISPLGTKLRSNRELNTHLQENPKIEYDPEVTTTIYDVKSTVHASDINLSATSTIREFDTIQSIQKYNCITCEKSYATADGLEYHEKSVHENVKRYKCDFCEKYFSQKFLKEHVDVIHRGLKYVHKCRICEKTFIENKELKQHLKVIHEVQNVENQENTPKPSKQLKVEKLDDIGHNVEKPGSRIYNKPKYCNFCKIPFKNLSDLKKHYLETHDLNRQVDKAITSRHNDKVITSRQVEKVIKSPKKHECEFCDKNFKYSIQLKNHRCSEKMEYFENFDFDTPVKHECEFCGRNFKYSVQFKNHKCPVKMNHFGNIEIKKEEDVDEFISCPVCQGDADIGKTIQCDSCNEWYHLKCVGLTKNDPCVQLKDVPFNCKFCNIQESPVVENVNENENTKVLLEKYNLYELTTDLNE